jgi:hypothetical protein
MATTRITATELARRLSDVLNRVRYAQETFVVERGGLTVCEIRPSAWASRLTGRDLVDLLRTLPHPGETYLSAVEAAVNGQPPAEGAGTPWDPKAS